MMLENRRALMGAVAWGGVAVIGVLLVFMIVQTFGLTSQVRETQKSNASVLKSAQDAAKAAEEGTNLIEDCVTPKGECAQRGQKQTAAAVGNISLTQIYSAACAAVEQRQPGADDLSVKQLAARIQTCVEDLSTQVPPDGQGG